jgi:hypothetical protein
MTSLRKDVIFCRLLQTTPWQKELAPVKMTSSGKDVIFLR